MGASYGQPGFLDLNAIRTLILDASTYAMEGLIAPIREEIYNAHAKRQWVEIGV